MINSAFCYIKLTQQSTSIFDLQLSALSKALICSSSFAYPSLLLTLTCIPCVLSIPLSFYLFLMLSPLMLLSIFCFLPFAHHQSHFTVSIAHSLSLSLSNFHFNHSLILIYFPSTHYFFSYHYSIFALIPLVHSLFLSLNFFLTLFLFYYSFTLSFSF